MAGKVECSETAFLAVKGQIESSEVDSAASGEAVGMAVAIMGSTDDSGKTSRTDGLGSPNLEVLRLPDFGPLNLGALRSPDLGPPDMKALGPPVLRPPGLRALRPLEKLSVLLVLTSTVGPNPLLLVTIVLASHSVLVHAPGPPSLSALRPPGLRVHSV